MSMHPHTEYLLNDVERAARRAIMPMQNACATPEQVLRVVGLALRGITPDRIPDDDDRDAIEALCAAFKEGSPA